MGIVKAKTITPLQAIRKYCLQCSCGDKKEVDECTISGCPLYVFRLGEPKTTKDEKENVPIITPGDMLDKPKCIVKEEKSLVPDEIIEPISKVDTGTGTICGEEPIIAETVTVSKLTKENNFVMPNEEAEKHTLKVEPTPSVNGTGTICGEDIVFAESKPPIEDGHKFVVDLDKVERTEDKPVKEKKQTKKKETKKKVEQPVAESKPEKKQEIKPAVEPKKDDKELDDIDLDDLFD